MMAIVWTKRVAKYSLAGIDPAVDWAIGESAPGRAYYYPSGEKPDWHPVVLVLNKVTVRDFAEGDPFIPVEGRADWKDRLRIPDFYINPPAGLDSLKVCSAMVKEKFFDEVLKLIPEYVRRVELSLPLRARSLPKT